MKDQILKGLIADNTVNCIAISGKELVCRARKAHGLSRVCTAALGRTLLMTSMMSASLKGDAESITCMVKGGGPTGNIVCTGYAGGRVKGYIEDPEVELPLAPNGKLDVAMAVGWFGEIVVVKDLSLKEPYTGRCQMISGEIAEDFAQYFTVSEQQPSLVYLGVRVDATSGDIYSAGGLLVQPLPQCPDAVIDAIQAKTGMIQELGLRLANEESLESVLQDIFGDIGLEITQRMEPAFRCDCSKERLERVLISLGLEEIDDMIEKEHGTEITCRFCNTQYRFSEADLIRLRDTCMKK